MGQIKKAAISRCSAGGRSRRRPDSDRISRTRGRPPAGPVLRFSATVSFARTGHSRRPIHKSHSECFLLRDHPILLFVVSLVVLWLSAHAGARVAARQGAHDDGFRADFGVILAAALTLLGLIIGFSFSMAISRYDQRKNLEEAEANAIGTEYLRADLLPAADGARVRELLKQYTDHRIEYYERSTPRRLRRSTARRPRSRTSCGPPCAARQSRSPRRSPRSPSLA